MVAKSRLKYHRPRKAVDQRDDARCWPCLATFLGWRENDAMTRPAVNLDDLSPEEQMDLLEEIWDRLSQHPAGIPLSDAQRAELDRRLDAIEDDIRAGRPLGRPWSEVRERLKPR